MKNYKKPVVLFTTIAALSMSTSAFALNEQDFANKLAISIEYMMAQKIEFNNVERKGKNIIITGLKSTGASGKLANALLDTTITFKKVKENKDGSYTAQSASFEDVDFTDEEINVKVNDIIISDILISANPEDNILDMMALYGAIDIGQINISNKGEEIFKIDNISVTNEANSDGSEFVSTYEVNGIYADLSEIEEEEMRADLADFGLTEINAKMYGQGVWSLNEGRLLAKENVIDVKNVGKLNINMDIFGYTLDVVKRMYDDQKSLVGLAIDSPEYDAKTQAMIMTLVSALSFAEFSIRFDDYGITSKVLDFVAKEQGTDKEQLVAGFSMMVPAFLSQFNMPELQAQISNAVSTYLKDPKNIEIKAMPSAPTPIMAFVALASNPASLVEALNVSVSANQ